MSVQETEDLLDVIGRNLSVMQNMTMFEKASIAEAILSDIYKVLLQMRGNKCQ